MRCHPIPYGRLPHQSKLFLRYVEDFPQVSSYYAHPPKLQTIVHLAKTLKFPVERSKAVAAALREHNAAFGSGAATGQNLERLQKGAVAIVTGQQVGLFSGPAYAIYKALTTIAVAEEVSRAGVPAVPVFWLATEDHDLDEVRTANWFWQGKLSRLELEAGTNAGRPVGRIRLGPGIQELVRRAAAMLEGPDADRISTMLQGSYRATETYGSAFGKLFARLFEDEGLILLDPLDERLHRLAAPIYRQAIQESTLLRQKLLARGRELDRAGYSAQVKVTSQSTLLFSLAGGLRHSLTESGGMFQAGEKAYSGEELVQTAERAPETLSPNALLRPVVQDFLLPVAACVGGPAEVAYYAQSAVLYEHLLGRMPVVLPRADFTILDAKAGKLLKRYGLSLETLWAGKQEVHRRMELEYLPSSLGNQFQRSSKELGRVLGRLRKPLNKLDPTLDGALDRARRAAFFHLEKLQAKAGRARDLREGILSVHAEHLQSLLYPNKATQSRVLCFLPFFAKWGMGIIGELKRRAGNKSLGAHQVVRFD
jgi:bacillithiol biosynthesis cysteine-adding enzyme BshC